MRFLLFILIVFNSFFGFNQNINKIFKTIKKGKFEVAYEELKTFQKTANQKEESFALGIVAEIVIFGSKKYSGYNPYNSLDLLKGNKSILERNISQVNEKLVKLNTEYLSLESQYLRAIYEDAVKFNDEILFYKAKQYCGECQFKDSLNYYLELNVYNSAKNKRTVEECNRFIFVFSSSKKVNEITELRNLIAFEQIKQQPNLTKINEYLKIYPSSKHFESVTIMRDSIEYASLKEDYQEHLNYIVKYPNSTFNGVIKDKLPKLLFNEVLKTNKSDEYINFLETYPNYTSVSIVKDKLENILYGEIKSSPSIIKLQQYKKYFPSNNRISELYVIVEELRKNSYLVKKGYRGNIKKLTTKIIPMKDENNFDYTSFHFNEMGYLIESNVSGGHWEEVSDYESQYTPMEFTAEFLYVDEYGYERTTIETNEKHGGGGGGGKTLYKYDNFGKLLKITTYCHQSSIIYKKNEESCREINFTYNQNGNLIGKGGGKGSYDVEYQWSNGKLTEKKVNNYNWYGVPRDGTGTPKVNIGILYRIKHESNNVFFEEYRAPLINDLSRTFEIRLDSEGNVIEKVVCRYIGNEYVKGGLLMQSKITYSYFYEKNKLIKINARTLHYTDGGKSIYTTRGADKDVKFKRDEYGNILEILVYDEMYSKDYEVYHKYTYKYDANGNWIERTPVIMKSNFSNHKLIKREIEYY